LSFYTGSADLTYHVGRIGLFVYVPLNTPVGSYQATVHVTDPTTNVTRQAVIPIQVTACVPELASQVCTTGLCGQHAAGCGVALDCGSCGGGSSCTNGVCCPTGTTYNGSVCAPNSCPAGTPYCPATGGCLTEAACYKASNGGTCTPAMAKSGQCS
jgi:hypothetical protein